MKTNTKKTLARLSLLLIATMLIGTIMLIGGQAKGWLEKINTKTTGGNFTKIGEPEQSDIKKGMELSAEISQRIEKHSNLPERSALGLGLFQESQASNANKMENLLETLAIELGSTRAIGAIRTLRVEREHARELQFQTQSTDPEVAEQAKQQLEKNAETEATLIEEIRKELSKEGTKFTTAEIESLCASPNAEEMASLISAFNTLKLIASRMESQMRQAPSQQSAQRYYGAQSVLLIALDKIQKKGMERITQIYIPQGNEIREQAENTKAEAEALLQQSDNLSPSERQALRANVESCITTKEMADRTLVKLQKNMTILTNANKKLQGSIRAAKNSHSTAMLQNEIIQLESRHLQEIAEIQKLTIPELVSINFADPENPTVSPRPLEKM